MKNYLCPACHEQNPEEADHCRVCGLALNRTTSLDRTTLGIGTTPAASDELSNLCADLLSQVPPNALLFFVTEEEEPVLFENLVKITIGRRGESDRTPIFDVTKYGEVSLGISRRHAHIVREDEQFTIEDLDSTNGTWVNRKRLSPFQPHSLASGDIIFFGPILKVVVCFHPLVEEPTSYLVLQLTPVVASDLSSLQLMTSYILPYLQSLQAIQDILIDYLGKSDQPLNLEMLQFENGEYKVKFTGAQEMMQLLSAWYQGKSGQAHPINDNSYPIELARLAAHFLDTLQATNPPPDKFPFVEKLTAALIPIDESPIRVHILT